MLGGINSIVTNGGGRFELRTSPLETLGGAS